MDTRVEPAYDDSNQPFAMDAAMTWRATVLTLFPEMFPGPLGISLAGRALASGLWALEARDIRNAATDKHRSVDDTPAAAARAWCCAPTCWRPRSMPQRLCLTDLAC